MALFLLVKEYKSQGARKEDIVEFYLQSRKRINNWDLVDCSAPHIVGEWCVESGQRLLEDLISSPSLWDRRIAVVGSYAFIRRGDFGRPLLLIRKSLGDPHDLMHKACGWMLREIGKRDKAVLEEFLRKNYSKLPRTTLRYAIERFPESERRRYLVGFSRSSDLRQKGGTSQNSRKGSLLVMKNANRGRP